MPEAQRLLAKCLSSATRSLEPSEKQERRYQWIGQAGRLALVPQRWYLPTKWRIANFLLQSSERGYPLWLKRKLNDQAEKNEGTQTRNPGSALLATQHIRLRKSWQLESRNQEDTLTTKLKSSEAKCKARRVLSGDLTPPPPLLILGSLVAASLSEGS